MTLDGRAEAFERTVADDMATSEHKYLSDFARKYYGEGKAEGRAEGEAKGAREALTIVLTARGITLGDADAPFPHSICRSKRPLLRRKSSQASK